MQFPLGVFFQVLRSRKIEWLKSIYFISFNHYFHTIFAIPQVPTQTILHANNRTHKTVSSKKLNDMKCCTFVETRQPNGTEGHSSVSLWIHLFHTTQESLHERSVRNIIKVLVFVCLSNCPLNKVTCRTKWKNWIVATDSDTKYS